MYNKLQQKELIPVNILVMGDRARYEGYMPPFAKDLPVSITWLPADISPDLAAAQTPDAQILLADAGVARITAPLIEALPRLKLIHTDGVGYNGVDTQAAGARGIPVCNCKGCNADGVAESAVMLMLMLTRHAVPGYRAVLDGRQMEYKEHIMRSAVPEFADHSIGLVGLGDIARATARRLTSFGNQLFYYAPHRRSPEEEQKLGVTYLSLEELAGTCDILSLHCPVTDETAGMVDKAFLARMKPGSYLVNTSRGQLIDNEAVRRALLSGHLAGAAFDTLWPEPTPADHPLVALPPEVRDRVVYAPHLGGNTGPAFRRAYVTVWENVRRVLNREKPVNIVNGL